MRKSRIWLLGIVIWTTLALLSASQTYAFARYLGRPFPLSLVFARSFLDWYSCGIFTPAVLWIAWRFPLNDRNWLRRVPVHVLGYLLFTLFKLAIFYAIASRTHLLMPGQDHFGGWLISDLFAQLLAYSAIVGAWHAYDYYRRFREAQLQAAELQSRLAHVQLDAIRAQLHPHFLFNALNAVSTLIHRDTAAADRAVVELGELLRQVLTADPSAQCSLEEELRMIDRYLSIMKVRLGERLRVIREIDDAVLDAAVPCMLLQPLVENALLHGIGKSASAGELVLRACREDGRLVIEVLDDGPGVATGTNGTGIGLRNMRALLQQLYGDGQSLTLQNRDGRGAAARVTIPFRTIE